MQSMQPAVPLMNLLEGYQDLQSVMAVLEAQQSFDLQNNTARFNENEGLLPLPEAGDRLRYLGYFLSAGLDAQRPIQIELNLGRPLAGHPFILILKAFSLLGTHRFRLVQGLSLTQEALASAKGQVAFSFEPLATLLRDPARITGFQVYLMKPKFDPASASPIETVYTEPETESGVVRAAPNLNVYKHIDTRV